MTEKESVDKAGMCGQPGTSFWTRSGVLAPTLCMQLKGHRGPCEQLSGEFLSSLDRELAADHFFREIAPVKPNPMIDLRPIQWAVVALIGAALMGVGALLLLAGWLR